MEKRERLLAEKAKERISDIEEEITLLKEKDDALAWYRANMQRLEKDPILGTLYVICVDSMRESLSRRLCYLALELRKGQKADTELKSIKTTDRLNRVSDRHFRDKK